MKLEYMSNIIRKSGTCAIYEGGHELTYVGKHKPDTSPHTSITNVILNSSQGVLSRVNNYSHLHLKYNTKKLR